VWAQCKQPCGTSVSPQLRYCASHFDMGDTAQVPKLSCSTMSYCATIPGSNWGRYGFDDGNETCGACRDGSQSRKSKAANY